MIESLAQVDWVGYAISEYLPLSVVQKIRLRRASYSGISTKVPLGNRIAKLSTERVQGHCSISSSARYGTLNSSLKIPQPVDPKNGVCTRFFINPCPRSTKANGLLASDLLRNLQSDEHFVAAQGTRGEGGIVAGGFFGHHKSHLNTCFCVLIPHEYRGRHGDLPFALIGSADVAKKFHEATVAALGIEFGFRRCQHQIWIFANFELAAGLNDFVLG